MKIKTLLIYLTLILCVGAGSLLTPGRVFAAAGQLYISPASSTVAQGQYLNLSIHEDSGADTVNGVQVKLTYPTDKLQFLGVGYTTSGFNVPAGTNGGNGTITISVGKTPPPLSGDQVVADINFKAVGVGSANIGYGCTLDPSTCPDGNAIERDTDNANILTTTTGAAVTINPAGSAGSVVTTTTPSGAKRILLRSGPVLLAKDNLYDAWVTEASRLNSSAQIYAAGDRIAYLDSAKNLYVKQGLYGAWVRENVSVDDVVLTPSRILVRIGGSLIAKDGLYDRWVTEMTGLGSSTRIFAAGNRIAFLGSGGSLLVKQGLGGSWVRENTSVDDAVFTDTRILIRIGGTVLAKDGLYDRWVTETRGLSNPQIYAAGDRIAYLDSAKNLYVKQGLYGAWVRENVSVDDVVLTPSRILVRIGPTLIAKDGLYDAWVTELRNLSLPSEIYAGGDRIANLDTSKDLLVKQGLYGAWVKEFKPADDTVLGG